MKQIATEQRHAAKWKLSPLSSFSYLAFPPLFVYEQVHFSPENETEKRRRVNESLIHPPNETVRATQAEGGLPKLQIRLMKL